MAFKTSLKIRLARRKNYQKNKERNKLYAKEYRRKNLYRASLTQIYKFLLENGYKKHMFSVSLNNDKGLKSISIFEPKIIAKGFAISIRVFNIKKTIFAKIISA